MNEHEPINRIYSRLQGDYSESWREPDLCATERVRLERRPIVANWEKEIPDLIEAFTARWKEVARLNTLEKEVILLKERCAALERVSPILVPIESLAPEPYEVVKPLHAVVRFQNDGCIASVFDANLSASGDTPTEAVFNLKDIITGTFEVLCQMDENELGPGPLQQRKVLEEFMRKKG